MKLISRNPETFNSMVGFELDSLALAVKYQRWVIEVIEPYLGRRILEIGAGTGNMSLVLPVRDRLVVTESDAKLFKLLEEKLSGAGLAAKPAVQARQFNLATDSIQPLLAENIDTVVSFNVIEHIADDVSAMKKLCEVLKGGNDGHPRRLISFVPAHQWAYGAVDHEAGHYRRYSAGSWRALHQKVAPEAKLTTRYFNSVGLAGWLVNGVILGQTKISASSIKIFETLCPYIKTFDWFLHSVARVPLGQSVIAVFEWE